MAYGCADTPGRLNSAYFRHLPVNDISVVGIPVIIGALCPVNSLLAGGGPLCPQPDLLQHTGHALAAVAIVIYHKGSEPLQFLDLGCVLFNILKLQTQLYPEFAAFAFFALDSDGPAHHFHNIFGDSHTQSRALDSGFGGAGLPLKGLKNMFYKVGSHADAVVLHEEHIISIAPVEGGFLFDSKAYHASRRCIFYGVAQEVQKHLVQPELVAVDVLVAHVHGVDAQRQALGGDLGVEDIAQLAPDLRQTARVLLDVDLAALDAAHVQNIVDEPQQVVAGGHDLS